MSGTSVYIVDGSRTPFLKSKNVPGPFSASDLAVFSGRAVLTRQPFLPNQLDEVILGCAIPASDEPNIGRYVALRLGCGFKVPGWTVMRNCASGLQAIDSAFSNILLGRSHLVLAGGTDALSRAPLIFNHPMTVWFSRFSSAKTISQRLSLLFQLRPSFFSPVISLLKGLTEPTTGELMGQTAENLAYRFSLTRYQMDEYAVLSHQRALAAQQAQYFSQELVPVFDQKGSVYDQDEGVRSDSSVERLGKLRPVFDRKYGQVTAGNSSQVTDGASFLLLASEQAVKDLHLKPLVRIVDVVWAGLDPSLMGLGPVYAISQLLKRNNMSVADVGAWEINEAFAAQVLSCFSAMRDPSFCRDELSLDEPLGAIPMDSVNLDGGAISLGHPVAASGARITLHLAHVMRRLNARYGVASLCIGGGMGGAVLLEKV